MVGCWDNWGCIGYRVTELQSDRVTELQTPKGTQYKGEWNFFVPDFNKLPYSLRSQGDKLLITDKNMGLCLNIRKVLIWCRIGVQNSSPQGLNYNLVVSIDFFSVFFIPFCTMEYNTMV